MRVIPDRYNTMNRQVSHRYRNALILILFSVFLLGLIVHPTPASAGAGDTGKEIPRRANTTVDDDLKPGKVVMFVVDRIGIDDLTEENAPNIFKLISSGGFALMNARLIHDFYGKGSYLVIGAGGRVTAGSNAGLAFNYEEFLTGSIGEQIKAGDIFFSRTGILAPEDSVVNLYIEEMIKNSDNISSTSEPGLLGQTLKSENKITALLGNADSLTPARSVDTTLFPEQEYLGDLIPSPEEIEAYPSVVEIHREASCIAMDKNGIVPLGNVSANLSGVNPEHTNVTTNYTRLVSEAGELLPEVDFMVVDLGQTSRVDEGSSYYTDKALDEARSAAIKNSDKAIGRILKFLDLDKDMVIVCTPTPSREMLSKGELLTPLVICGPETGSGALLKSSTTARTGIVSNFDIAPTIIEFFRIDTPGDMEGRPLLETSVSTNIKDIQKHRDTIVASSTTRKTMVRFFVISAIVLIVLFMLFLFFRDDIVKNHKLFWRTVFLMVLSGPLAYLIYPAFGNASYHRSIPLIIGITLVAGIGSILIERRSTSVIKSGKSGFIAMAVISGTTLFVALLDPLLGSPLMTLSAFGSDIVLAGRYYGIGNLYMGVVVGASLLFICLTCELATGILDKPWKRYLFAGIVLLATCIFLGYPGLGANVGGLITAAAASVVTVIKLEGKPVSWKKLLIAVVIVILCIAILIIVATILPEQSSHAGKALSRFRADGISSLFSQAMRKLSANWSLIFVSIWRLILLLAVIGALILNWKFKLIRKIKSDYHFLAAGMAGMITGLVVALLLNDSGIEPAGAISLFILIPLLLLSISGPIESKDASKG